MTSLRIDVDNGELVEDDADQAYDDILRFLDAVLNRIQEACISYLHRLDPTLSIDPIALMRGASSFILKLFIIQRREANVVVLLKRSGLDQVRKE